MKIVKKLFSCVLATFMMLTVISLTTQTVSAEADSQKIRDDTRDMMLLIDTHIYTRDQRFEEPAETAENYVRYGKWKDHMPYYGVGEWRCLRNEATGLVGSFNDGHYDGWGFSRTLTMVNQFATPSTYVNGTEYAAEKAITGFIASSQTSLVNGINVPPETLTDGGITYHRMGLCYRSMEGGGMWTTEGISDVFKYESYANLNAWGDIGTPVFLYYTTDPAAGNPIKDIKFSYTVYSDTASFESIKKYGTGKTTAQNFNEGTAVNPSYVYITRCEYSKTEIINAWKEVDPHEETLHISTDVAMTYEKAQQIVNTLDSSNQSFITDIKTYMCADDIYGLDLNKSSEPASTIVGALALRYNTSRYVYDDYFPYSSNNYSVLLDKGEPADFNQNTWDEFIGLVYQQLSGTVSKDVPALQNDGEAYRYAITGIFASYSNEPYIMYNDIRYDRVYGLVFRESNIVMEDGSVRYNTWVFDGRESIDMNYGAGGDYLYLYMTRDDRAGNPITSFFFQGGSGHALDYSVNSLTWGTPQDFNAGTGDRPCYLWYSTYGYSKSEIATAKKMIEGITGDVSYQYPILENDVTVGFEEKHITNYYEVVQDTVYYRDATEGIYYSTLWGLNGQDTWYVARGDITIDDGAIIRGNVHLILTDGCNLTVNSLGGAGIRVPVGCSLSIYGQVECSGNLIATGGKDYGANGAGIGGNNRGTHGDIIVYGGNIIATGANDCAGIGGGDSIDGGNFKIYGGTVYAYGTGGGAGIGGGASAYGHNIVVRGGTVEAYGGASGGAGLGGGGGTSGKAGNGSYILINNGTVDAYGGNRGGAGIGGGGGLNGNGTNIDITGGTVTARGVNGGAGIGGGFNGGCGTGIGIIGGTVVAECISGGGAGIGGGYWGTAGTISIQAGTVTAKATDGNNAIGNGQYATSTETNILINKAYEVRDLVASKLINNNGENLASALQGKNSLYILYSSFFERFENVGSVFGTSSPVILIGGSVILIGSVAAVIYVSKKKKKTAQQEQ